jgi:hypothetical protein
MESFNKKKILLILLALLTFGSTIASCAAPSDNKSNVVETTDETTNTETTSAMSTIEKKDFGGYEYKIISTNQDKRQVDVEAESENGSTLNDLVYRRNAVIEDTFNVVLSASDDGYDKINSMIQKNVQAGDNPYSLYMTNSTAYTLAVSGFLTAWNDIDSMDITKPWWDQTAISQMSVGGKSFLITGDISPTCLLTSECILFNKNLFDDKNITYPYDDAFAGTWTLDKMIALSTGLTTDVNGDGEIKVNDDLYSFTLWCDAGSALFYGAGGYLSTKDESDYPVTSFDIDKITNIYEKIYKLVIDNKANYSKTDHEGTFKLFNQGRAYFCDITFQKIEMFLRDMENDYGVLPLPKYDEAQASYLTNVSGAGTMVVMPKSASDLDIIGAVTDGMAAASYDMITPSLYDIIASTKNVRDEQSSEMVQLIIRNRVYDPVRMYFIDGNNFADDLLAKSSETVSSYFASKQEKSQKQLQKIIDSFIENN